MTTETNKPITMRIDETRKQLVNACNSSTLPPCILELIVKGLYDEISMLAKRQLEEDELAYAMSATDKK